MLRTMSGQFACLLLLLWAVSVCAVAADQSAARTAAVATGTAAEKTSVTGATEKGPAAASATADGAAAESAEKQQDQPEPEYVRIRRDDKNLAVALETSIVSLNESQQYPGAQVDLIGAIHLGERDYYRQLNRLFEQYDVLLYEAVMPEEAVKQDLRPGGGQESRRPALSDEQEWTEAKVGLTAISVLQLGMKDALGLEFQLSGINYSRANFVHADMTSEEFEATMKRRGESFSQMLAREMAKAVAAQQEQNPLAMNLDLMLSALSSDRVYRVRRIAAVQLAKASEGDAFAAYDGTSTIITERNIKALEILQRELKKGHRRIGVFYGAGHLADMEERLLKDHGFRRSAESWLTAWHLRPEPRPAP